MQKWCASWDTKQREQMIRDILIIMRCCCSLRYLGTTVPAYARLILGLKYLGTRKFHGYIASVEGFFLFFFLLEVYTSIGVVDPRLYIYLCDYHSYNISPAYFYRSRSKLAEVNTITNRQLQMGSLPSAHS